MIIESSTGLPTKLVLTYTRACVRIKQKFTNDLVSKFSTVSIVLVLAARYEYSSKERGPTCYIAHTYILTDDRI